MSVLLLVAIALILIALLGFIGVWAPLRTVAWVALVVGIVLLLINLVLR